MKNGREISFTRIALLPRDALERLIAEAARPHGRLFAYQNRRFVLNFRLRGTREVAFSWRSLDGGLFPPISGVARVLRFGPVAALVLHATYCASAGDGVSELLGAALGKKPALAALRGAGLAMAKLAADRNTFVLDRLGR